MGAVVAAIGVVDRGRLPELRFALLPRRQVQRREDDGADALRMGDRQLGREVRARVVADDGRGPELERIEQACGGVRPTLERLLPAGSRVESPKPGVSIAITRRRPASNGTTSRYSSQERGVW